MVYRFEQPLETEKADAVTAKLIQQFTDTDEAIARPAFHQLFNRYGKMVWRHALGIVKRTEIAEEIQQQTFLKAWEKRTTFQPTGSFGGWLAKIAENLAISTLRKKVDRHSEPLDEPGFETKADRSIEPIDLVLANKELVEQALMILAKQTPERTVQLLRAYYFENQSRETIAQTWNIELGNVDVILSRGRATLKEIITKQLQTRKASLIARPLSPAEQLPQKPPEASSGHPQRDRVIAVLKTMPDQQAAQILYWHLIDKLPDSAITAKTGKSRDGVSSYLKRQRRILAAALGEPIPDLHSLTPQLDVLIAEYRQPELEALINQLKNADTVRVLKRHLIDDLPGRQIALETGEKENSIQVRISRGKAQLETLLASQPSASYSKVAV